MKRKSKFKAGDRVFFFDRGSFFEAKITSRIFYHAYCTYGLITPDGTVMKYWHEAQLYSLEEAMVAKLMGKTRCWRGGFPVG
jgi:hypothetical protein